MIKDYFKLEERGTSVKTELVAGLTTFLAMAYILAVNPNMLSNTGMDKGAVFTATAIAAIIGTLIMGLLANYPVALAPGMGMNAFFTFTVCLTFGYTYQQALAGILVSGLIFMLLSISGLREKIINAIPQDLKFAVGAGIGFFIAFIGLKNALIIVPDVATFVKIGDITSPEVLLALFGLFLTVILYVLRVPGAIFLGIIGSAIVGMITGQVGMPDGVVSTPDAPHFGAFIDGFKDGVWDVKFIMVIFTFLFIDFFDTAGTLIAVGNRAGLIKDGVLQGSGNALLADSTATVVGSIVGTSSTTSYIESLSGIEAGGRTGLTSVFTSLFFFVFMFFSPLLDIITPACTAPALIMVGILMAKQLKEINWEDTAVAVTAFLTVIMMPLTFSIAEGIAVGFVFYPVGKIAQGKWKEVNPIMYILSILFILYFAFVK